MTASEAHTLDIKAEIAADREIMARLSELAGEAGAVLAQDRKRGHLDGGSLAVVAAQEREAHRGQMVVGARLRALEAELSRRQQTKRWATG